MNKKLLVLDLDETLIYACEKPLERPADFTVDDKYYVYKRPYLAEFLPFIFQHFIVGIWTSSSSAYASAIVEMILTPEQNLDFLWARERCTYRHDHESDNHYWIKNLKKLKKKGYDLKSILMVDDSPEKVEKNYGNHLRVSEYTGREDDDELLLLMKYLDLIKQSENILSIEKRGWRKRIEG